MPNPWINRANKPKKVSLKALATGNGNKPGKTSLAGLKRKPLPQKQTKQDFYAAGLLYWNAQITERDTRGRREGIFRPVGTVDVSNGDQTYTFHNRYGSWMADIGEMMAEPARIAYMLGTNMGQLEMYQHIRDRFEAELKVQKVPTLEQQYAAVEEHAKTARARTTAAKKRATNQTANPWIKKVS